MLEEAPQPFIQPVACTVHEVDGVLVLVDGEPRFGGWLMPCWALFSAPREVLEAIERLGPTPSLHECGLHLTPSIPDSPEELSP